MTSFSDVCFILCKKLGLALSWIVHYDCVHGGGGGGIDPRILNFGTRCTEWQFDGPGY